VPKTINGHLESLTKKSAEITEIAPPDDPAPDPKGSRCDNAHLPDGSIDRVGIAAAIEIYKFGQAESSALMPLVEAT